MNKQKRKSRYSAKYLFSQYQADRMKIWKIPVKKFSFSKVQWSSVLVKLQTYSLQL